MEDTYETLINYLDQNNVSYRLIDHQPEGRTEIISEIRGNKIEQAAKCMIVMVKLGRKTTKYILCVIPGNARVNLDAVKSLMKGTYISFASSHIAERLAGSIVGTVLPFSFNPELELIVDHSLLENEEIYFNAARLDRSMVLNISNYVALANPRFEKII